MKPLHWKLIAILAVLALGAYVVNSILNNPVQWLVGGLLVGGLANLIWGAQTLAADPWIDSLMEAMEEKERVEREEQLAQLARDDQTSYYR